MTLSISTTRVVKESKSNDVVDDTEIIPLKKSKSEKDEEESRDSTTMLWIRLLFLFYFSSIGSILPFLSVYYQSLGHGGDVIGVMGSIKPMVQFLLAPLWGMLSDYTQKPIVILQTCLILATIGQFLISHRPSATFIMAMKLFAAIFAAPIKSLLDNLVLSRIPDRSKYGRLRLFGQVGFALGTNLSGQILSLSMIEEFSTSSPPPPLLQQHCKLVTFVLALFPPRMQAMVSPLLTWLLTGYKPIFVSHVLLAVGACVCVFVLSQDSSNSSSSSSNSEVNSASTSQHSDKDKDNKQPPRTTIREGFLLLLQNSDAVIFFTMVLVTGLNVGVNEAFANLRIRELGGSAQDFGLFRIVGMCGGVPMFWYSGALTNRFGVDKILLVILSIYMLRFLALSVIVPGPGNVMYALPMEALRGASFAAFMSSATVYTHKISPPGLQATMLMFLNGTYAGLGQSLGSLFAGRCQTMVGTALMFRYVAMLDSIWILAVILYFAFIRKNLLRLAKDATSTEMAAAVVTSGNDLLEVAVPSSLPASSLSSRHEGIVMVVAGGCNSGLARGVARRTKAAAAAAVLVADV